MTIITDRDGLHNWRKCPCGNCVEHRRIVAVPFDEAERVRAQCRICKCTADDCSQCIAATGEPCHWVEADLCSRCAVPASLKLHVENGRFVLRDGAGHRVEGVRRIEVVQDHDITTRLIVEFAGLVLAGSGDE